MRVVNVAFYRVNERVREAKVVEKDNTRKEICEELGLANPDQLISVGRAYLGDVGDKTHELIKGVAGINEVLAAIYLAGYVTGEADKTHDVAQRLGLKL